MIPVVVKMAEDELFGTWIEHIGRLHGLKTYMAYNQFFHAGFGRLGRCPVAYPEIALEKISDTYKGAFFMPSAGELLLRHTMYPLEAPLLSPGRQAQLAETVLRREKIGVMRLTKRPKVDPRVCPLCAREDMERYGHVVIHVRHQHSAACAKHKVRLVGADEYSEETGVVEAPEGEVKVARMWEEIFEHPGKYNAGILSDIMMEYLVRHQITIKDAVKSAGVSKHVCFGGEHQRIISDDLLGWFGMLPDFDLTDEAVYDKLSATEEPLYDPIIKTTCDDCGYEYWTHRESLALGVGCPRCRERMSDDEVMVGIVSRYADGNWTFMDSTYKTVKNTVTGEVASAYNLTAFWDRTLGERRAKGNVVYNERAKRDRIGMIRDMPCGDTMKIVGYKDCRHITVELPDGSRIPFSYDKFEAGVIPKAYMRLHKGFHMPGWRHPW